MTEHWADCPKCGGTGMTINPVQVNLGSITDPYYVERHIKCGYVSNDMPLGGGKFKKPRKKKE